MKPKKEKIEESVLMLKAIDYYEKAYRHTTDITAAIKKCRRYNSAIKAYYIFEKDILEELNIKKE